MKLSGEITTNCACVDEDGNEFYNEFCDGTCYEYALEDFAQIVVAVELVFVGDTSKGLDGFCDGHGGLGAVSGVSKEGQP